MTSKKSVCRIIYYACRIKGPTSSPANIADISPSCVCIMKKNKRFLPCNASIFSFAACIIKTPTCKFQERACIFMCTARIIEKPTYIFQTKASTFLCTACIMRKLTYTFQKNACTFLKNACSHFPLFSRQRKPKSSPKLHKRCFQQKSIAKQGVNLSQNNFRHTPKIGSFIPLIYNFRFRHLYC